MFQGEYKLFVMPPDPSTVGAWEDVSMVDWREQKPRGVVDYSIEIEED